MSLRPELGDPEVAEAMHGAPEGPGIPWRTPLQLRLPESPSLTIAAAILDPRVDVMTSAEVVPWLRRSTPRGAPDFCSSCSCSQERQRRLSSWSVAWSGQSSRWLEEERRWCNYRSHISSWQRLLLPLPHGIVGNGGVRKRCCSFGRHLYYWQEDSLPGLPEFLIWVSGMGTRAPITAQLRE